jgi:hypothetical protein
MREDDAVPLRTRTLGPLTRAGGSCRGRVYAETGADLISGAVSDSECPTAGSH